MSDPTTGEPWYVPADLANKHLPAKKRDALDEVEEVQESEELNCSESNMGKGHLAGSKGMRSPDLLRWDTKHTPSTASSFLVAWSIQHLAPNVPTKEKQGKLSSFLVDGDP